MFLQLSGLVWLYKPEPGDRVFINVSNITCLHVSLFVSRNSFSPRCKDSLEASCPEWCPDPLLPPENAWRRPETFYTDWTTAAETDDTRSSSSSLKDSVAVFLLKNKLIHFLSFDHLIVLLFTFTPAWCMILLDHTFSLLQDIFGPVTDTWLLTGASLTWAADSPPLHTCGSGR